MTTYKARSRSVYLPSSATWYDFWSGAVKAGGTSDAPAPYDQMPLFVKAGSIIPQGPEVQYAAEKKADPITIWVYAGADGKFNLYEDDGNTYNYEKGELQPHPDDLARRDQYAGDRPARRIVHRYARPANLPRGGGQQGQRPAVSLTPPAGKSVTYTGRRCQWRCRDRRIATRDIFAASNRAPGVPHRRTSHGLDALRVSAGTWAGSATAET